MRLRTIVPLAAVWCVASTAALCAQSSDSAAAFPWRPLRLVSGFTSSGAPNTIGRIVAAKLTELLGQQAIVDNALASAEVTFGFASIPSAMPLINAKRVRPIAVTSEKRMSALPATPTMTEAGVPPPPGLDLREWYGVIVPAATPVPIVDKLNAEMLKVFKRPDVQTRLTAMGAEFVGSSPQVLSKQFANYVRTWAKWVKEAGVRVE